MSVRLSRGLVALAIVSSATAACVPAPSGNEINFADEGMRQGVAATRGLAATTLDNFEIGRSINDDRTIKDRTHDFQPNDTIYASVRVTGAANSALVRARWTDDTGQPVHDETRLVTPSRDEVVAVQASRPQGWAGGRYRLEVYLDDKLADAKDFTVAGGESSGPGTSRGLQAPNPTGH